MRKLLIIGLIVVSAAGSVFARFALDPLNEKETLMDMAYLPNGKMLGWMSGGMDDVVSDMLWLRSLRYVMDHFGTDKDYTYLYKVFDITTDFDPNFVKAYRFGGYFLTGVTDEYEHARALLTKGYKNNPDSWEIAYELGSIYNLNLKDPSSAAEWFDKAARNPRCPRMIREHATVIYEEEGRLEQARDMWLATMANAGSGSLKKVAEWNVKRVESRIVADELKRLVEIHRARTGRLPQSLTDLVSSRLIGTVPSDAYGEDFLYFLDSAEVESFSIETREILRREMDKRITYLKRFVLTRFKHKYGRWPNSLDELVEKTFLQALPRTPRNIPINYDPSTGKMSYDKDLPSLAG